MLLLVPFVTTVIVIALALNGVSRRGNYFVLGVLTFTLGVFTVSVSPSGGEVLAEKDPVRRPVAEFLFDYSPLITLGFFGAALGGFAGGLVRRPVNRPPVTKRCSFCAEEILQAAIVCKHCRRDLPAPTTEG